MVIAYAELEELRGQSRQVSDVFRRRGSILSTVSDEPPEEHQIPDMDRTDDDANFEYNLCESIEELGPSKHPYVNLGRSLPRAESNFFKFFLDGSVRTYHIAEKNEGGRGYPLMATEVASAAVKRREDGGTSVSRFARWIGWLIPPCPPMLLETRSDLLQLKRAFQSSTSRFRLDIASLEQADLKPGLDLRTVLRSKATAIMKGLERQLALELQRSDGEWLVLDGNIQSREFLKLGEAVGLAKSFSRKPLFRITGKSTKDVVALLSGLREGERTLVFKHSRGPSKSTQEEHVRRQIAFWYLRLRSPKGLDEPLQGIVKIDYRFSGDEMKTDDIDLVNTISRALLAEKLVSPYPSPRWHAHIYPIYLAENYIKSSLLSPLVFRSCLRGR